MTDTKRGEIRLTLSINGLNTAGDLRVTGFATERTAVEVGFILAEALRKHYSAEVTASVDRERYDGRKAPMATRSALTGEVWSFRACKREMRDGRLAMVRYESRGELGERIYPGCPVHDTDDCLETYFSESRLRSWSPWTMFLIHRRLRRA